MYGLPKKLDKKMLEKYSSEELFDILLEKNDYYNINILIKNVTDEKLLEKFFSVIIEKKDYIDNYLNKNEKLFDYCYRNKLYTLLFQFTSFELQSKLESLFTSQEINEMIVEVLKTTGNELTGLYNHSYLILKYCIDKKIYGIFSIFNPFDLEVMEKMCDMLKDIKLSEQLLQKYVDENKYVPAVLIKNNQIYEYLYSKKEYMKLINSMHWSLFDKAFFTEANENGAFDSLKDNDISRLCTKFCKSVPFLEIVLEAASENDALDELKIENFSLETILACLDKYGDIIAKVFVLREINPENYKLTNRKEIFEHFYKNPKFLRYILKNNYIDYIIHFDESTFDDDIFEEYFDPIFELIKEKILFFNKLVDKRGLTKKLLETKNYQYLFATTSLTIEEIEKNYDIMLEYADNYIENDTVVPFYYYNSDLFLEVILKKEKYEYLVRFSQKAFASSRIIKYYDKIIEHFKNDMDKLKNNLFETSGFLMYCIENNYLDLIDNIGYDQSIEEVIKDNFSKIIEICEKSIPSSFYYSPTLLKYYIEQDRKDIVRQFSYFAVDRLYDEDKIKYVAEIAKEQFPPAYGSSFKLFKYFVDHDDFSCIKYFDAPAFGYIYYNFLGLDCAQAFYDDRIYYLNANISKIMDNIGDELSDGMSLCMDIFNYCVENDIYKFITKFHANVYSAFYNFMDHDEISSKIIDTIDKFENKYVPENISLCQGIKRYTKKIERYDLFIQFPLNLSYFPELTGNTSIISLDDFKQKDDIKIYCKILGLTEKELMDRINKFYKNNDEVLSTIMPYMLSPKMDIFREKDLEKIVIYPDLQRQIYKLNDKELLLISKIFPQLDNDEYDLTGVLVKVLNNIKNYSSLIDSIDINKLDDEKLKKLILVIQKENNIYSINSMEDFDKIDDKINSYYNSITTEIKNNNIDIDRLREAIFDIRYGLSIEDAKFMCDRYCHDMDMLKSSNIDRRVYNILESINKVYTCDDIDVLKFLFITSKRHTNDFYVITSLESSIRKEYAKMYTDTLYKVKEEHKLNKNNELFNNNREVYDLLNNSTYNGIHPDIYILDGDFNLQIHALGAYRDWSVPENFKDDWLRPKIAYHGICTSYIGNNQIANARAYHPIYGFDDYEESALLCAGNYDLYSDRVIKHFDSGYRIPFALYPPKEMIDNTRHTHNEMVIERRNIKDGQTYKRTPSYVVYLVDDINNKDNFSEDNTLYQEILQASIDQGIPILIVDRLKYAKKEKEKCNNLLNEFYKTKNYNLLDEIILTYCNNIIGCKVYDSDIKEYNEEFSNSGLVSYIDNILNNINNFTIEEQIKVYETLIISIEKENTKRLKFSDGIFAMSTDYLKEKLSKLNPNYTFEEQKVDNYEDKKVDLLIQISNYYYHQNEYIRNLISCDLDAKIPEEEVILKIKNGIYEQVYNDMYQQNYNGDMNEGKNNGRKK